MQTADLHTRNLLIGFSAIIVLSLMAGIAGYWYFLAGVPALALVAYLAVVDFKKLFYLLFFFIPLTVEVWLPNGTVTDVPTEMMMVMMMFIYFLYVLRQGKVMEAGFLKHPISLMLLLHLAWMFFAVAFSEAFIISFKFFLAKIWYVTTFFFLAGTLMRTEDDVKAITWTLIGPLCFTILFVTAKHATYGFTFADINHAVGPFYRNKVAYACTLTILVPFVWITRHWYRRYSWKWLLLTGAILLMLLGIQLSYTRAAYVTLLLAIGTYYVIQWRLMKMAVIGAAFFGVLLVYNEVKDNAYLDQKPTYEKTITHDKFSDLLSATTKGRDVSTMERVYRWVAGGHMIADKPGLGFGPGTFTTFYKEFTVTGFTTYVSANLEGSGIHCYYLMTAVEQGIVGALIFIALVFVVLLKGETIYHQTSNPARRRVVMIAMLTTVIIDGLLLMNDLVETDKIGSFFFLCMALLVNADLQNRREKRLDGHKS
ncbi:MAG: O-antigen ligase family protein [Lewinellaceae bacterium]|nr:O-antigen ligase family protein [Saprospiraceae bacterium]MCB9338281.1 O-antigen ligase family protein [Lewinellaceae bacterium]